ncbi:lysophospholipid acyltransferase family protein [Motilimonas cestriensis]|uniref:L-ornithine N(alpha)-acyltransferase n=1 Tax=Motilimonas cestriensis TaxID=2742685 RepID=A0ABS8WBD1_9GAMM|nr:lysophospholipid acyltransferase family protein [Motilimonas cestriensis]MCE2595407.1 lysophospholipid acyltransferase family protein [Motilimonas cestriensis]
MFSVDQVVSQHFPQISNKPWLRKPVTYFLRRLLHEKEFIEFGQLYPHLSGFDFIEKVLDYFDFSYRTTEREIERIPVAGRVVIVANHPIGSLDGLALLQFIHRIRPDVKVVANELLMSIKPLQPTLLPVNNMNGLTVKENLQNIHNHLQQDGALIIFPAGEVSRLRPTGIKDIKWNSGFLRMASRAQAPILPIHIQARNSALFYGTSMLYKPLATLLLVKEMFKQNANTVKMTVGKMVPYDSYQGDQISTSAKVKLLQKQTYRLAKGKNGYFRTETPIAHPEPRIALKQAVERCEKLGTTPDNKHIYLYKHSDSSPVLRELGRLREVSFRAVGEGTGTKRDIDHYDSHYLHLILWDADELEIAGAYRFAKAAEIIKAQGDDGLYSQSLFHYGDVMKPCLAQGLELGRSFVQPKYWGRRSLDYLWLGIGAFIAKHPQYRYLFGPVSISDSLPKNAKDLLIYFYQLYFSAEQGMATAKVPYQVPENLLTSLSVEFVGNDYKQDFITLKAVLDNMGTAIPTLYKQYSEVCDPGGVKFLDFGVDPDFNNCIDGLVLVDLAQLKANKRQRYINAHLPKPVSTELN